MESRNLTWNQILQLASCFESHPLTREHMLETGATVVSGRMRKSWVKKTVDAVLSEIRENSRPGARRIARVIYENQKLREKVGNTIEINELECIINGAFIPETAFASCGVPEILNYESLAAWCRLGISELEWFCDARGMNTGRALDDSRQHYVWRLIPKRGGGGHRVIEAPKERMKLIQRQILCRILDKLPSHPASTGFRAGGSVLEFVKPHAGKRVLVKMDIQHFFPGIGKGRVRGLFHRIGYPGVVADALADLCTTVSPQEALALIPFAGRALFGTPHLPQGSPASPALSNLLMFGADRRLAALAEKSGGIYTRYADDLVFSWAADRLPNVSRFVQTAGVILLEEGFDTNCRKTKVLGLGGRQRVAGIVVNARPNVPREEFDQLRAILHNCLKSGIESQNREGRENFAEHLRGRIAWVNQVNPGKGARLLEMWDRLMAGSE